MSSKSLGISKHLWAEVTCGQCSQLEGFNAFCVATRGAANLPCREEYKTYPLQPRLHGLVWNRCTTRPSLPSTPGMVLLIPRRDVPRITNGMNAYAKLLARRYVLVAFVAPSGAAFRQRVSRLAWRTPLIRLGRGLVLLPQVRTIRFRPYRPILLRPSEYVRGLADLGAAVWYAPRLQVYDMCSEVTVRELAQHTTMQRAERLVKASRVLLRDAREVGEKTHPLRLLRRRLAWLRARLALLRLQVQFFNREFGMDFRQAVTRAAAAVSRTRLYLAMCD